MDGEHRSVCPLCDGTFAGGDAYAAHLRDVHGLVDDEGLDGTGPEPAVLAAAAAALARSVEADPAAGAVAEAEDAAPTRGPLVLRAVAVLLVAVAAGWLVVSAGEAPPTVDARRPAVMPEVEVAGTSAVPSTAPPTAPPATSPASTSPPTTAAPPPPTSPPTTAAPPPPTTTPPPATTTPTAPPTTVTATEATVVRCTKEAGDRTLVFTYVLTGSAADGLHEASVTARVSQGPITVATVPALEPDGDPVTVRLQPGPVTCD